MRYLFLKLSLESSVDNNHMKDSEKFPLIPVPITHHWNCSSLELVYNLNIKPTNQTKDQRDWNHRRLWCKSNGRKPTISFAWLSVMAAIVCQQIDDQICQLQLKKKQKQNLVHANMFNQEGSFLGRVRNFSICFNNLLGVSVWSQILQY